MQWPRSSPRSGVPIGHGAVSDLRYGKSKSSRSSVLSECGAAGQEGSHSSPRFRHAARWTRKTGRVYIIVHTAHLSQCSLTEIDPTRLQCTDKERNASQKLSTSHDHSSAKLYTERLYCSHSIAHSHRATQGGAAPTVSLSHCAVSAFKACRRSRALTVTRRQEREATAPSSERSVPGSGAAPARHHPRRPPPRSVRSLDRTHQR